MSRLSNGEKEFVSGFGDLRGHEDALAGAGPGPESTMQELDARGISSPLHVLRAHRALRAMRPGEMLKVITSSQQTLAEFQALSKFVVGHELVSQEQAGDEYIHVLRKTR